jgi:hypothetical protein
MKELAPYGQYLAEKLRTCNDYEIAIIFMGSNSHAKAESLQVEIPSTLCLPSLDNPFRYIWPLRNCDVYLLDGDYSKDSFIKYCAGCFFSYGANIVNYISSNRILIVEKGVCHVR